MSTAPSHNLCAARMCTNGRRGLGQDTRDYGHLAGRALERLRSRSSVQWRKSLASATWLRISTEREELTTSALAASNSSNVQSRRSVPATIA